MTGSIIAFDIAFDKKGWILLTTISPHIILHSTKQPAGQIIFMLDFEDTSTKFK
jgi:hypothetical protein